MFIESDVIGLVMMDSMNSYNTIPLPRNSPYRPAARRTHFRWRSVALEQRAEVSNTRQFGDFLQDTTL
jgi:hypothetical protein